MSIAEYTPFSKRESILYQTYPNSPEAKWIFITERRDTCSRDTFLVIPDDKNHELNIFHTILSLDYLVKKKTVISPLQSSNCPANVPTNFEGLCTSWPGVGLNQPRDVPWAMAFLVADKCTRL